MNTALHDPIPRAPGPSGLRAPVPRWVWVLVLLLPLLPFLVAAGRELGGEAALLEPNLPPCVDDRPELTVTVLDVSSSVIADGGADRRGRSFDETILLAEHLGRQACSADDRLGAVIFASRAVEIPPTLLTSHSVIAASIKRPPESEIGGSTDLAGALARVVQLADRFDDHRLTVIVLSDMAVDDEQATRALLGQVAGRSSLHLVALGDVPDRSFHEEFQSVIALETVQHGDVASALADVISNSRTNPGSS